MVWGEIPSPIGTYTGRERVRFPPFENCFEENSGINIDKTVSITNLKSSKCPVKRESKKGLKCCCCPVTETFKRILSKKIQTKHQENMIISTEHIGPDLIFVIFYTTAFWGQEILHLKEQFFCVPIGNFCTWLIFLHNQRLWWLWQIWGVYTSGKYIDISSPSRPLLTSWLPGSVHSHLVTCVIQKY